MKSFHTIYDIRQYLLNYNTVIYTRDPKEDLLLMEEELRTLYEFGLIEAKQYVQGRSILRGEVQRLEEKSERP
ncbi:YqgQ family protein [Geomicrobium sp. JCM 19039]|uniref:YqgQ family protein n=1 Tax=Geomicrobium sp. JCM 19039 TaxID=1460636 RepID=UPI0009DD0C38|nr:YqgQ family protein [Geomicrobium sp. JCM 19039]